MKNECPKGGYIWLTSIYNQTVVCPTSCKTWGCRVCIRKVLAAFRLRVQVGSSRLGECAFITVTYRTSGASRKTAPSVSRDLGALLRKTKLWWPKIAWLKVVELTRQGQPHLHLIAGPVNERIRCYGRSFDVRRFEQRFETCLCISHRMSRVWKEITGDSFIIHTTPVLGAKGAAAYLSKYMAKGLDDRSKLESLGFLRRWSRSRNWPTGDPPHFALTDSGGWLRVAWHLPTDSLRARAALPNNLRRVGDDLVLAIMEKRKLAALEANVRSKVHVI